MKTTRSRLNPSHGNNPLVGLTLLAASLIGLVPLAHAEGDPIYWVGGNGDWSNTNNWSPPRVPWLTDHVYIQSPGTYTVTVDNGSLAGWLTLGGASGTPTMAIPKDLTVTGSAIAGANTIILLSGGLDVRGGLNLLGDLEWSGGSMVGVATVWPGGVVNLITPSEKYPGTLINHGTINWKDGGLIFWGSQIDNRADGLLDVQKDGWFTYKGGTAWLNNAGELRKSAGAGTLWIGIDFTNSGLVSVQSGQLSFMSGFSSITSSGTFAVQTNAAVWLSGGTYSFLPGNHFEGDGYYGASGGVTIVGTIAGANFQLDGGLGGNPTVAGTLQWNDGYIQGTLTVATNSVVNLRSANVKTLYGTLVNHGTVNWLEGGWGFAGGQFDNRTGGLLDLQRDGLIGFSYSPWLNNAGTLRKSAGAGTLTIQGLIAVTNTGLVDAQSGTIRFDGPYSQTGGRLNVGLRSASDFGSIAFYDVAPLTGTLSANLIGSFSPSPGTQFQVISSGGFSGGFTSLALPNHFIVSNTAASVFLAIGGGGPVALTPPALAGTNFTFSFQSEAGLTYDVESNGDLNATNWTPVRTLPGDGSLKSFVTPCAGIPQRFFRMHQR